MSGMNKVKEQPVAFRRIFFWLVSRLFDVGCWHEAADPGCPLFGRYRGESGRCANRPIRSRLTHFGSRHPQYISFGGPYDCLPYTEFGRLDCIWFLEADMRRREAMSNIAICGVLALVGGTLLQETAFAQDKPSLTQEQREKLDIERRAAAAEAARRARADEDTNNGCDDCGGRNWFETERRAIEAAKAQIEREREAAEALTRRGSGIQH